MEMFSETEELKFALLRDPSAQHPAFTAKTEKGQTETNISSMIF